MRKLLVVLALSSCMVAQVDSDESITETAAATSGMMSVDETQYDAPYRMDACSMVVEHNGVEIPVECYWGPPRHDDVEHHRPGSELVEPLEDSVGIVALEELDHQ
jgi:hypothetical protein